ncbi:endonuclease III [Oxalobacter sp. OxGP1]|uniref:endonuclease III n=1 Tax=Oxalobacter paeniformigenes TaxID=2946594 RepID=UPI0022AFF4F2|nr:endonuclease III [Oxalobacter paeniformigenes]MCZ4053704.1 endonuclease III [Oxalobacter paeniformigenes]
MSPEKVTELFERFKKINPNPRSELQFQSPYELLVAVMLSAQATDISVNKATEKLYPVANTPEAIVRLGADGLMPYVKTINLYPTKSRNIVKMSEILLEKHHGEVPADRASLEALPGVGRKTANVVLNAAFGQNTMAVDTHIFRVANRTNLAPGKTVLEVESRLVAVIPERFMHDAHHWLLLHGRYVCKARSFRCDECPIRDLCEYPDKTPAANLPPA